jgi:hypothetical protein
LAELVIKFCDALEVGDLSSALNSVNLETRSPEAILLIASGRVSACSKVQAG